MTKTTSLLIGVTCGTIALIGALASSQAQPKSGGVVRFAVAEESRGLDSLTAHRRFSEAAIHVQDGLAVFDPDGKQYGALAKSWEANENATEYTIRLRDDVVFHDGSKFTGASVEAHFARVFDSKHCCNNAYQYMGPYAGVEHIDEHTIKVKFSKPWGPFNFYIGLLDVTGIPSDKAWSVKGMEMNRDPVGAGPFKFVEWVPQSHVRFERFDDYKWGSELFGYAGPAYLDGIEVKFIADQATRSACLEAGDCDIIKAPGYTDIGRLAKNDAYELVRIPQTGMPYSFVFNTAKWPTDQVGVRKAINLAIDREKINIAAFLGERRPLYATLSPATREFLPEAAELIYFAQDEARELLSAAGFADPDGDGILEQNGKPAVIDLYIFGAREANPSVIVAEAIQADLRAVGIDVNINVRPWDDQSVVAMNEDHHMINFDMPLPTASVLGVMFNSRETPSEGHYGMGFTWFHKSNPDLSAKLDVLLDAGDNAPNLTERRDKFHAAQKIIGENYLGVPISQGFTVYAMVKELKGVKYNDAGHAMFNAAHIERD